MVILLSIIYYSNVLIISFSVLQIGQPIKLFNFKKLIRDIRRAYIKLY